MIIGIAGPTGSGKGVAADFLAQRIPGAVVKSIVEFPDILSPGRDNGAGVVIIPDVQKLTDAAQIRRHGKLIHMYGRAGQGGGKHPSSVDIEIEDRDYLVGNHAGTSELFEALDEIAREVAKCN